ncbi:hypothetical protein CR513_50401, partial [Mucuna pruriens]
MLISEALRPTTINESKECEGSLTTGRPNHRTCTFFYHDKSKGRSQFSNASRKVKDSNGWRCVSQLSKS